MAAGSSLLTLGYLAGHDPAPEREGVLRHSREKAYQGLNLMTSGHGAEAVLMDMSGRELHRWGMPYERVWPGREREAEAAGWRRVHLLPGGELLAIYDHEGIVKLDRRSRVIWQDDRNVHHDLFVDGEGRIYTLSWERRSHPDLFHRPVMEDFIEVRDADGRLQRKISVLDALRRSIYAPLLERLPRQPDILHTNTIEVLDGSHADSAPFLAAGNILISIRHLDTIAVVDGESGTVIWALTGMWRWQHQPTLLPSGRILLFDNLGLGDWSRVLEIDPLTHEVAWRLEGSVGSPFFSRECGSAQRLPNGNTLITESDRGRAFEVTPGREVVWEFLNPRRAGPDRELIATLYEVVRLPESAARGWLAPAAAATAGSLSAP